MLDDISYYKHNLTKNKQLSDSQIKQKVMEKELRFFTELLDKVSSKRDHHRDDHKYKDQDYSRDKKEYSDRR